jgi:hypothetical protein
MKVQRFYGVCQELRQRENVVWDNLQKAKEGSFEELSCLLELEELLQRRKETEDKQLRQIREDKNELKIKRYVEEYIDEKFRADIIRIDTVLTKQEEYIEQLQNEINILKELKNNETRK